MYKLKLHEKKDIVKKSRNWKITGYIEEIYVFILFYLMI